MNKGLKRHSYGNLKHSIIRSGKLLPAQLVSIR